MALRHFSFSFYLFLSFHAEGDALLGVHYPSSTCASPGSRRPTFSGSVRGGRRAARSTGKAKGSMSMGLSWWICMRRCYAESSAGERRQSHLARAGYWCGEAC
ncbi:hypothetical protein B0H16DRAFT_1527613 [Mycena metata]|uniref:Secreted protein n=1 Tax=Mycena metata TaxID=1033252 RepID=A0AAD7NJT1_9AGAR|nr:hypothetical protein B0H16DRAFT_1527613 [Mycena metata]